jgi:hypothetical protein
MNHHAKNTMNTITTEDYIAALNQGLDSYNATKVNLGDLPAVFDRFSDAVAKATAQKLGIVLEGTGGNYTNIVVVSRIQPGRAIGIGCYRNISTEKFMVLVRGGDDPDCDTRIESLADLEAWLLKLLQSPHTGKALSELLSLA